MAETKGRSWRFATLAVGLSFLVGCAAAEVVPGSSDADSDTDGPDTETGTGDSDTDTGSETDTETGDAADTEGDVVIDHGPDQDTDTGTDTSQDTEDTGPVDKCLLDVVVSIDIRHLAHEDEGDYGRHLLEAFRYRFETFLEELLSGGPTGVVDIRVAVLDGCPVSAGFHTFGSESDCGMIPGTSWVESASPDFGDRLQCLLAVEPFAMLDDCSSDEERSQTAYAAAEAIGASTSAGFLRGQALLMVVAASFHSDTELIDATGYGIREALVSEKGDEPKDVFLLATGGRSEIDFFDEDCDSAYGGQNFDVENSPNLMSLASAFGAQGLFTDVCRSFGVSDPIYSALEEMRGRIEARCGELLAAE